MSRLRSLEVVRAIAALLVVLFHIRTALEIPTGYAPLGRLFAGGHRGVDLFFVLSGFIIAHVHGGDLGRPDRLGSYLFNRVARIYPTVWIMAGLAIGAGALGFGTAYQADRLSPAVIATNVLLLPQLSAPAGGVTWTLTYEVFFYAVFAVAIVNLRLGVVLILAWQVAIAAAVPLDLEPGYLSYYLAPLCLDFGVGLVCAWWLRRPGRILAPVLAWPALLAAGLASFTAGMWFDAAFDGAGALCALGAGAMIVALVRLEQANRLRAPDLLVFLGGASFAIYMVHFPTIRLLSAILRRLDVPVSSLLYPVYLTAGVLAGVAFDQWADKPIQRSLRRLKGKLFTSRPPTDATLASAHPGAEPPCAPPPGPTAPAPPVSPPPPPPSPRMARLVRRTPASA